MLEMTLRDI